MTYDYRLPSREVGDVCALLGYCSAHGEDETDRLSHNVPPSLRNIPNNADLNLTVRYLIRMGVCHLFCSVRHILIL